MGSGKHTRFWKDIWLEECPLIITFSSLFKICHDQDISMERGGSCSWNLSYRRNFGERDGRVEGVDVKAGVCYTYKGGGYTNLEISDPREVHNKGHV